MASVVCTNVQSHLSLHWKKERLPKPQESFHKIFAEPPSPPRRAKNHEHLPSSRVHEQRHLRSERKWIESHRPFIIVGTKCTALGRKWRVDQESAILACVLIFVLDKPIKVRELLSGGRIGRDTSQLLHAVQRNPLPLPHFTTPA